MRHKVPQEFSTDRLIIDVDGVQKHIRTGPRIWRVPFGIQLVPGGLMAIGCVLRAPIGSAH